MINIDLRDPHFEENIEAILALKHSGIFSDNEIQHFYDRQILKDREETIEAMKGGPKCQRD